MPGEQSRRRVLRALAGAASVGAVGAWTRSDSSAAAKTGGESGVGAAETTTSGPALAWSKQFGTKFDRPIDAVPAHGGGAAVLVRPHETDHGLGVTTFQTDGTRRVDARLDTSDWGGGALVRTTAGYVAVVDESSELSARLIALGPEGDRRWERPVDPDRDLETRALAAVPRPEGGVVVAGTLDTGVEATWLHAVDADGNREWGREFEADGFEVADITRRPDGGYLLAGRSWSGDERVSTLRGTDESGVTEWRRTLGGYSERCLRALPRSGGAVLLGENYDGDGHETILSAVDDRGFPVWRRKFDRIEPHDLVRVGDGFAVAAGSSVHGADRFGRRQWAQDIVREDLRVATLADGQLFVAGRLDWVDDTDGAGLWAAGISLPDV